MSIIILAVVLATVLGLFSDLTRKYNPLLSNVFFLLSATSLLIPLALRGMGVDYQNYILSYMDAAMRDPLEYWSAYEGRPEPLYAILNYVAFWTFGCFQGVNVLCAVLTIVPTFWAMSYFRNKVSIGLTVFAFGFSCYMLCYGLNRMMIAVAIVFSSYVAYIERKTVRYFMLVLIAGLFHYSAFIMMPMFLLLKWLEHGTSMTFFNGVKRIVGVTLAMAAIIYIFPKLTSSYSWHTRYDGYFVSRFSLSAINNSAQFFPVFLYVLLNTKRLEKYFDTQESLVSMVHLLIMLTIVGSIFSMHRLCYYLFPAGMLMYGVIPRAIKAEATGKYDKLRYGSTLAVLITLLYGGIWLARPYYTVDTLWMPYLEPYVLGKF